MITIRVRAVTRLWLAAALFIANHAAAQTSFANKLSFSIGGELGLVTGYEQSYHSVEAGAIAQLQYRLTNSIAFTLATGYDELFSKTYQAEDFEFMEGPYGAPSGGLGVVPLKAGLRVFTDKHFYFGAEGGTCFYTSGYDYYDITPGSDQYDPPIKERKLVFAAGFGWFLKNTDIGFRYDSVITQTVGFSGNMYYGVTSFHVAYIIK
jgi:hypothetical protein